ncbi:Hsp20/alpha crystallin family protein [Roseiconus nitratireducens]|uniref:Hsp20/alpha crystallin family protein n=1 Tax=Roseiconus nitratireducens TaxID=2605748 RepID=A0A5M6DDE4_9BACT|nr:Hsp20/alpha crystallin family protein [Roseiconus nitratireducens]KAA5543205.1 Hsp20/alpha crystallin family protein [Roseiconus nitratireducens]
MSNALSRGENQNQVSRLYDDPFSSLENRMSQLFRGMFGPVSAESGLSAYPVDVEEDDDSITVEAEMPGFKPEEVDVNIENGVLTIKAERSSKSDEGGNGKKKKTHLQERRYTRVQRSFTLPRTVEDSDIDATLKDGVLKLVLKKAEESKPRRIQIRGES